MCLSKKKKKYLCHFLPFVRLEAMCSPSFGPMGSLLVLFQAYPYVLTSSFGVSSFGSPEVIFFCTVFCFFCNKVCLFKKKKKKIFSHIEFVWVSYFNPKKKKVFLKNNDLRCEEMWFLFFTIKWLDNIGLKLLFMVQIIKKDLIILLRLSSLTPFSKKKKK